MPRLILTQLTPKGKIKHKNGQPLAFDVDLVAGTHAIEMPPVLSGFQVEQQADDGTRTLLRTYKQEELLGTGVSDHPAFSLTYVPAGRRAQNRLLESVVVAAPVVSPETKRIEIMKRIVALADEMRGLLAQLQA